MGIANPIQIVVGGQYGSEAKGAIAGYLALKDGIDIAVRTGAVNAGHTVVYESPVTNLSERVAMQQLPVAWVNPNTTLVVGAGALVDLDILKREVGTITRLTGHDARKRVIIDYRAYIHRPVHVERSRSANRHHSIGATGKGCSEALMDRIRSRGVENWTVGANLGLIADAIGDVAEITDTEAFLNTSFDDGANIQLEGTQGQLLDLYLGPYPYTTHKQTGPAQWMLEAGLSPGLPTEIIMVVRTYPIRVAGNSGPLADEMSWSELADTINVKRGECGLPPIVDPDAVDEFDDAVRNAARKFKLPSGSDGTDQHKWSAADRVTYREALSELNKAALESLPDHTVRELCQLFEMTTVTKKLRRIAAINDDDLRRAARQVRPGQVALTFMNYMFPERWFTSDDVTDDERVWLEQLSAVCDAPITLVNRGPDPRHIVEV